MESELRQLGLTSGEARVFNSLTRIGQSKVGKIVRDSRVSYSKVYDVLERLLEKGLISYVLMGNTKHFAAVEPHRINDYLESKEKEIETQKRLAKKLIPRLRSMVHSQQKTKVELFIGKSGLLSAYEILLAGANPKSVLRYFYPFDESRLISDEFYGRLFARAKPRLKQRGIATMNFKHTKEHKKLPNECEMRFVHFPLPGTMDILNERVLIVTWATEVSGILISSSEIASHYTNYFDSLWKIAKT